MASGGGDWASTRAGKTRAAAAALTRWSAARRVVLRWVTHWPPEA